MTDNIKPEHYLKGEIDLYEAFSQIFPHNEYRAGMQMIALRYMFRDKNDRVEDIGKAIYTLERLKEKEIEYRDSQVKSKDEVIYDVIDFLNRHGNQERNVTSENIHKLDDQEYASLLISFLNRGFEYIARDSDGELYVYDVKPIKFDAQWSDDLGDWMEPLNNDYFPEVKWSDEEPTKIADLLETLTGTETETPNTTNTKTAGQYLYETYRYHEDLLKRLRDDNYLYLARDKNGFLYAYDDSPVKFEDEGCWDIHLYLDGYRIQNDNFPEVQWSDEEPTAIADLLDIYRNGGENGNEEE